MLLPSMIQNQLDLLFTKRTNLKLSLLHTIRTNAHVLAWEKDLIDLPVGFGAINATKSFGRLDFLCLDIVFRPLGVSSSRCDEFHHVRW